MDNNLPPDDNQQPTTPVDTPPPASDEPSVMIPEVPEEKPQETPLEPSIPSEPQKSPADSANPPKEPTIEIGSLDKTSGSTIQETSGSAPKSKSKKAKTVLAVLGLLLIIASLPLTLILVKQRQEIRKEAAGGQSSGWTTFCNITLGPEGSGTYSGGKYTTNYKIRDLQKSGASRRVEIHKYGCYCSSNNLTTCGTQSGHCDASSDVVTVPSGGEVPVTISVNQPSGDCGTLQTDLFVISVDGDSGCHNNQSQ